MSQTILKTIEAALNNYQGHEEAQGSSISYAEIKQRIQDRIKNNYSKKQQVNA